MILLDVILLVLLAAGIVFVRWRHSRLWRVVLEEQVRREGTHPLSYRRDQREQAIQQRLSRHIGRKKAFAPKTLKQVIDQIEKHPILGPRHKS